MANPTAAAAATTTPAITVKVVNAGATGGKVDADGVKRDDKGAVAETYFKLKRTTALSKLTTAYRQRHNVGPNVGAFSHNGATFSDTMTPAQIGLAEGDAITFHRDASTAPAAFMAAPAKPLPTDKVTVSRQKPDGWDDEAIPSHPAARDNAAVLSRAAQVSEAAAAAAARQSRGETSLTLLRKIREALKAGTAEKLARYLATSPHPDVNVVERSEDAPPLYLAAQRGQGRCVELLLDHHADVNRRLTSGATALYVSCLKGHAAVAAQLLDAGASIDLSSHDGITPLYAACEAGHINCVASLLQRGAAVGAAASDGRSPLHAACQNGRVECAEALVAALLALPAPPAAAVVAAAAPAAADGTGGDSDASTVKDDDDAGSQGTREATDDESGGGIAPVVATPARTAAAEIDRATTAGETALHLACAAGKKECATLLLDARASVDGSPTATCTPLYAACDREWLGCVRALLAHSAGVNLSAKQKRTPLSVACERANTACVELLINAHASVVHFAADGRSPLHHASVRGSAAITSLLLRANCSVDGGGAANLPSTRRANSATPRASSKARRRRGQGRLHAEWYLLCAPRVRGRPRACRGAAARRGRGDRPRGRRRHHAAVRRVRGGPHQLRPPPPRTQGERRRPAVRGVAGRLHAAARGVPARPPHRR